VGVRHCTALPNYVNAGNAAVHAIRLDETEHAEQALADIREQDSECGEIRISTAELRLAQDNRHRVIATLAPVLDGSVPVLRWTWRVHAFMLEAKGAEPDGALGPFLISPAPGLLEPFPAHRTGFPDQPHLDRLPGRKPASQPSGPEPPLEPLSEREIRVLRYLPTHMSAPEIADELHVSPNTVKTHMRHLYAKLGTHRRAETIARALDLLAPSAY
jgi:LuxR family maltose regulon positive regulatory protein